MISAFALRQRLRWAGLPHHEAPRAPGTGAVVPATERGAELYLRYRLARWSESITRETLDETLGALDLLDRLPKFPPASLAPASLAPTSLTATASGAAFRVIDVGAKNWRYLGALRAWLEAALPADVRVQATGVELDAYRLYSNLRTRISYARYFTKLYANSRFGFRYLPGDICEYAEPAELVTWFFPFVSDEPHRAWGLPGKYLSPARAFRHVASLLSPGARLVMANQGEWEWKQARPMLAEIPGLRLESFDQIEGSLHASPYPIFLTLWTREA